MKTPLKCPTTHKTCITSVFLVFACLSLVGKPLAFTAQTPAETHYLWNAAVGVPAANALLPAGYLRLAFQNDYGLKELMHKDLNFAWVSHKNCFHLHLSHYGFSKFGKLSLQTGYARAFGPRVAVGMSVWYFLQHAEHYAANHSLSIDLSALFFLSKKLGLSLCLFNPIAMKYGFTGSFIIPMQFRIEAFYRLADELIIAAVAEKFLPGKLEIGLNIFYQPVRVLFLQGTFTQVRSGLGVLCRWKQIVAGVRVMADYRLGITTQCELNYFFTHEKHQPASAFYFRSRTPSGAARHRRRLQ